MKNIPILLFSLLLLSACRPQPLEIEIPILEPQAVVFSQVFPDQYLSLVLTNTLGALDFNEEEGDSLTQDVFENLLLNGAYVTISYRDQLDPLIEVSPGVYLSIETPQYLNETYTLDILTPAGHRLQASSQVLPQASFTSLRPQVERQSEDTLVSVDYKINDLPGDNWYLLHFYTNRWEDPKDSAGLDSLFESGGNYWKKTELIEDQFFPTGGIEGTIELPNVHYSDSLFVTLSNVSEEYYRFLEVRKNATNLFTELTREPVNSPSNVDGGLGFFNMHFPVLESFDLREF